MSRKIKKSALMIVFGTSLGVMLLCLSSIGHAAGPWPACATASCTDVNGCVEVGPGESLKIGTFLPEVPATSDADTVAQAADSKYGLQLGINTLNVSQAAVGGNRMKFLNHSVSWVSYDSGCGVIDTATLRATAASIVSDPKTLFTMGTFCSSDALRVIDIFRDAGHTLISSANTNPRLTDETTYPSFFARLSYNDKIQGKVVAGFANASLHATTAATIDDGGAYGRGLTGAFRDNFVGTTVAKSLTATQTPDQIAADLAQSPPSIIFYAGNLNSDAIAMANAIRNNNAFASTALAFGDSQASSNFLAGGSALVNAYVSSPDLSALSDPEFYNGKFLPAYQRKFGVSPSAPYHVFAYDIAHVMGEAAEAVVCRASNGVDRIGRKALYDALLQTSSFPGLAATYECTMTGDCNTDPVIAILQVQNGQFVKIQ